MRAFQTITEPVMPSARILVSLRIATRPPRSVPAMRLMSSSQSMRRAGVVFSRRSSALRASGITYLAWQAVQTW